MRLPSGREDSGWNWITGGARFFRATSQRQHHSACKIDHGLSIWLSSEALTARQGGPDFPCMYCWRHRRNASSPSPPAETPADKLIQMLIQKRRAI